MEKEYEFTEEEYKQALKEIEDERNEIRAKLASGEYKMIDGKIYNSYGNCMGYFDL